MVYEIYYRCRNCGDVFKSSASGNIGLVVEEILKNPITFHSCCEEVVGVADVTYYIKIESDKREERSHVM